MEQSVRETTGGRDWLAMAVSDRQGDSLFQVGAKRAEVVRGRWEGVGSGSDFPLKSQ